MGKVSRSTAVVLAYSRIGGVYFLSDDWIILGTPGIWHLPDNSFILRPLSPWIIHGIFSLVGLSAPALYHFLSLLFHLTVVGLFFVLIRKMFQAPGVAFVAAAAFGLSVAHAEAVWLGLLEEGEKAWKVA